MSSLKWESIDHAAERAIKELEGRRDGRITSLQTGSKKLNDALLDGIPWNKVMTIAARSKAGKSMYLEQLKRELVDCNPKESLKILFFN